MESNRKYKNLTDLINDFKEQIPDNTCYKGEAKIHYYKGLFIDWLKENKGWHNENEYYENDKKFIELLTKNNFMEFIRHEKSLSLKMKQNREARINSLKNEIDFIEINSFTLHETTPKVIYDYFMRFGQIHNIGNEKYNEPPFRHKFNISDNGINYSFFVEEKDYNLFMRKINNNKLYNENFELLNNDNVQPYLLQFAKGFNVGYYELIETIKSNTCFAPDNETIAYEIFKKVYNTFPYGGTLNSFFRSIKTGKRYISLENLYKEGIKQGYFYKAWETIIKNPLRFEKYFIECEKNKNLYLNQTAPEPQQEQGKPQDTTESKLKKGRPHIKPKALSEYFINIVKDRIPVYIEELKKEFRESEPKEFVYMIHALEKLKNISFSNQTEIFRAFELEFEKKYKQQSLAKHKDIKAIETPYLGRVIDKIKHIKESHTIY